MVMKWKNNWILIDCNSKLIFIISGLTEHIWVILQWKEQVRVSSDGVLRCHQSLAIGGLVTITDPESQNIITLNIYYALSGRKIERNSVKTNKMKKYSARSYCDSFNNAFPEGRLPACFSPRVTWSDNEMPHRLYSHKEKQTPPK